MVNTRKSKSNKAKKASKQALPISAAAELSPGAHFLRGVQLFLPTFFDLAAHKDNMKECLRAIDHLRFHRDFNRQRHGQSQGRWQITCDQDSSIAHTSAALDDEEDGDEVGWLVPETLRICERWLKEEESDFEDCELELVLRKLHKLALGLLPHAFMNKLVREVQEIKMQAEDDQDFRQRYHDAILL